MLESLTFVIFVIIVALFFDFVNGFHDSANSIATIVSTRVLPPKYAVAWAAFFNFVAAFTFGVGIAKTVGKGIIHPEIVDIYVILGSLIGAIVWDIITWYLGLPTSSSHALVGGFAGAAVAKAGWGALIAKGIIKIGIFIFIAPILGLILGFGFMVITLWLFRKFTPSVIDKYFRKLQLLSAAAYSLGHGTNDAQKTMGIITILLFSTGHLGKEFYVPTWVILACHAAIALGTLAGGWRIVKTMGMKITKLKPVGGFCAEAGASITLFGTALAGIPVSTTHTITGSILGIGSTIRLSAVRWGVAKRIVWAWILTIPGSFIIAYLSHHLISVFR